MRVVASWSGGKESCFACYKAISDGFEVSHLLNLVSEEGRCRSHGIDCKLMVAQSQAIGIPIVQKRAAWNTYERDFKMVMRELMQRGIEGAVFGDIHDIPGPGHAGWVDRVCGELGVKPVKPLWGCDPEQIINDFIDAGFEAFVIRVKADILGDEWLGRRIDRSFVRDLRKLGNTLGVHVCGEFGEYHTFVTDGPLFKRCLKISFGDKVLRNGRWTLDISGCDIVSK